MRRLPRLEQNLQEERLQRLTKRCRLVAVVVWPPLLEVLEAEALEVQEMPLTVVLDTQAQ
jgi:hypothetical protein